MIAISDFFLNKIVQENNIKISMSTVATMSPNRSAPQTHFILKRDASQATKFHGYTSLVAENFEEPI